MNREELYLARLYATAFMNTIHNNLSSQEYDRIERASNFLRTHTNYLFIFKLPLNFNVFKKRVLHDFLQQFDLALLLHRLTDVLVHSQRLFLLRGVLVYIEKLYKDHNHIVNLKITSSHQLKDKQITSLKKIFEIKNNATNVVDYTIDKRLIAGIRMQSNTLLWEHSIAKQLRTIEKDLYYGD